MIPNGFLCAALEPDPDDEELTRVYLEDRALGVYVVVYPEGKAEIEALMRTHKPLYLDIPVEVPRYTDDEDLLALDEMD